MSRSNPTPTNPAKRFFTWKGSTGKLVYWDKENSKEVEIKLPFEFLVLDQLATITGYSDHDQSGYWSNEVRSVAREELTVRTSKGTKEVGLYRDIKSSVGITGAKYAKSVYIAYFDTEDDDFVIGNLKAAGAALTAWIELGNKYALGNGKIRLMGSEEAKKGATKYFVPTFEWDHSETVEDEKAVALDKELQVYLSQYLAKPSAEPEIETFVHDDEPEEKPRTAKQLDKDEDEEIKSLVRAGAPFDDEEMPEDFLN